MAGARFFSGLSLVAFCFHQKCAHAVKSSFSVSVPQPTKREQNEVVNVWGSMSTWGSKGHASKAANIDMFMRSNTMEMINTDFSFRGNMPSSFVAEDQGNDKFAQIMDWVPTKMKKGQQGKGSGEGKQKQGSGKGRGEGKQKPKGNLRGNVAKGSVGNMDPDNTREVSFGPVHIGKYMSDDSLVMTRNKLSINGISVTDRSIVIASLAQQSQRSEESAVQASSLPSQVYMYDDSLSMDKTVFTMNVGGAAASFIQETDSSVMSLDTLDINMFMYGNSMLMKDSEFQMNVNKLPTSEPTTLRTAGVQGGDLTRLLFLATSVFGDAAGDQNISYGEVKDTRHLQSVWSWMKRWSSTSGRSPNRASINMHMYDNTMRMDNTAFTMNVGEGAGANINFNTLESSNAHASETSLEAAAREYKVYSTNMAMKDSIFKIGVGSSLIQESEKSKLPTLGPGSDIEMHMYNNKMSMTDTVFNMNIGSQASLRKTKPSSRGGKQILLERAKQGGTMNINRLNIKMYMYENHVTMKKTTFAWTIS
eukprot:TRINITY_DN304_c0_g2_i3.p1 TRINITY_DN304_c0_g2~~TRINITY_DN304_c0_g2_i3.p1  ORF type:complete len:534 (+),score=97.91 TRINITY_DN304_c0_g2_i3:73-1674(+)